MYVKVTNGSVDTYPYTIGQLRRDNPQVSFPKQIPSDMLADFGVYEVTESDKPDFNERTETLTEQTTPTGSGSSWTIGWTKSNKSSSETADFDANMAAINRQTRNTLLADTDMYGLSDMTMTTEMQTYRQALRDITSHSNWPNLSAGDWPTKP